MSGERGQGTYGKEAVEVIADRFGCDILRPEPNQLLLDLDTEEQYEHFKRAVQLLKNRDLMQVSEQVLASRSGRRHVIVTLVRPIDPMTRLVLEMGLGSDPMRGLLGYFALLGEQPLQDHSVLFRPRSQA